MGFSLLLIPVSLIPYFINMSGLIYFVGAFLLGVYFLTYAVAFVRDKNETTARTLMRVSLIYLPVLLIVIALDSAIRFS